MKRGFTLIELLAVIVILAIILLIAMPIVLNVIAEAKKGSFENSSYGLLKAAENEYFKNSMNDHNAEIITYIFEDGIQTTSPEGGEKLQFSGNPPIGGYIRIYENGEVEMAITDGKWAVTKSRDDNKISKAFLDDGTCCLLPENGGGFTPIANIEYETSNEYIIYPDFTSGVALGQTIGANKNRNLFYVLTATGRTHEERAILKFNTNNIDWEKVANVELFAYYYYGDIPSRQQTHPVRRMIVDWEESDNLLDNMMTSTYNCSMASLNTSNYGYGWRKCDVTDIVEYWENNPNENYGLVIDHNRGLSNAGGYWNRMEYHSIHAERKYWPHLKITYTESYQRPKLNLIPDFNSSVPSNQIIGNNTSGTYFSVLSAQNRTTEERGLLYFELPDFSSYNIKDAYLYAYYYFSDTPARQQTHPIRRVITNWEESDYLLDEMMTSHYNCKLTSLDTSNYGYGWRMCDVTDILEYWAENPSENYGLVIDHNRGEADGGGYWNRMRYYSINNSELQPYLIIYLEEK